MNNISNIVIAAKCLPGEDRFKNVEKAGLNAVELYTTEDVVRDRKSIIQLCKQYKFRYAVHAPNFEFNPCALAELVKGIKAEITVFHDIYWEEEWNDMAKAFKDIQTKLCVENTYSVHGPVKFMRRYGMGRCLDLEHAQMECFGVYEDEFINIIKKSDHIHLTGYISGSDLWHTHIHHSPEHGMFMLDLLMKAGYQGLVVSEAKTEGD